MKSFLFTFFLVAGSGAFAQNVSNAFSLHYQNNSLLTRVPEGSLMYEGSHVQFTSTTYVVNHPLFSLGLGLGLSFSQSEASNHIIREFSVPVGIVQKTNLPALHPILDYIRFAAYKNFLLNSALSMNGGDFNEISVTINKDAVSAEAYLGWNFGKKGFAEVGYMFKQINSVSTLQAKHNLSAGVGFILGEAPRSKDKVLEKAPF